MAHAGEEDMVAQIITEFSQAFAVAKRRWAAYLGEELPGLTGTGMIVLQTIRKQGPATATDICHTLMMDKAFVSRQIAQLRTLGLVDAQAMENDRRVTILTPTPQALAFIERMRRRLANDFRARFSGWDSAELELLRDSLARLNESIGPAHAGEHEEPAPHDANPGVKPQ